MPFDQPSLDEYLTIALGIIAVLGLAVLWWEMRQPKPIDWITSDEHARDMLDAMVGKEERK